MRTKILLVTTVQWPSAARLAGAFANLGAEVAAVFPRGHMLASSRYLSAGYTYKALDGARSVAAAIIAAEPDHIIPCDDRALLLLLSLKPFAALLQPSLGPLEGYATLVARAPSIAAARQEGIVAPLTLAVPDRTALPQLLSEVGLPCVMKSDASWGGEGVRFVASLAEAERAFSALNTPPPRWRSVARAILRKDSHFLHAARHPHPAQVNVQALVEGKPATTVFAARNGKVLGALHMDVESWKGGTGPASLMSRLRCSAMDEAAKKIAARFSLSGLHGLDFMRDRDGVPHLIEINPRATQICHLPLEADLPACLMGVPERLPVTSARQIALFPQLLTAGTLPPAVFRDVPWDDPGVLNATAGDSMPDVGTTAFIELFGRPDDGPPILRRRA